MANELGEESTRGYGERVVASLIAVVLIVLFSPLFLSFAAIPFFILRALLALFFPDPLVDVVVVSSAVGFGLLWFGSWLKGVIADVRSSGSSSRASSVAPSAPPVVPADRSLAGRVILAQVHFATIPLRGVRTWKVSALPLVGSTLVPALASPFRGSIWPSRELSASCERNVDSHGIPDQTCTCGIYALKRPPDPLPPDIVVLGEVELFGRVIEAEDGFRAEHGRMIGPLRMTATCSARLPDPDDPARQVVCRRRARSLAWSRSDPQVYCLEHQPPADSVVQDWETWSRDASEWIRIKYGVECQVMEME